MCEVSIMILRFRLQILWEKRAYFQNRFRLNDLAYATLSSYRQTEKCSVYIFYIEMASLVCAGRCQYWWVADDWHYVDVPENE
jgi:hypothetical protein